MPRRYLLDTNIASYINQAFRRIKKPKIEDWTQSQQ